MSESRHAAKNMLETSFQVRERRCPTTYERQERQQEERQRRETNEILTDVTLLSGPSAETVAVKSTNQIFARVRVDAGISCALVHICEGRRVRMTPVT